MNKVKRKIFYPVLIWISSAYNDSRLKRFNPTLLLY